MAAPAADGDPSYRVDGPISLPDPGGGPTRVRRDVRWGHADHPSRPRQPARRGRGRPDPARPRRLVARRPRAARPRRGAGDPPAPRPPRPGPLRRPRRGATPGAQLLADPDTPKLLQDKGFDAAAFGAGDTATVGDRRRWTGWGSCTPSSTTRSRGSTTPACGSAPTASPPSSTPATPWTPSPGTSTCWPSRSTRRGQRSREMTAFLRRLAAPHAIPVHDALLSTVGRALYLTQAGNLGSKDTRSTTWRTASRRSSPQDGERPLGRAHG